MVFWVKLNRSAKTVEGICRIVHFVQADSEEHVGLCVGGIEFYTDEKVMERARILLHRHVEQSQVVVNNPI